MFEDNEPKPKFLIVDGHALVYRAYHAFPQLLDKNDQPAGAVYGFLRILLSVLRDVTPACWLIAFDDPAPTKRRLKYDFYKANRPEMPEDLRPQVETVKKAVAQMGAPVKQMPGIEADDIIGTLSRQVCEAGQYDVLILTGDKDSFQLVNDCIHVLSPNSTRDRAAKVRQPLTEYNPALVEQKMQIPPALIVDFKALAGDASDNIPGVTGIGAKTAVALLRQFGSLDGIYQAIDNDNVADVRASVVAKLINFREQAYVSQELARIDTHVGEVQFDEAACRVSDYNKPAMVELLEQHGFNSLIKLLPDDEFESGLQEALF